MKRLLTMIAVAAAVTLAGVSEAEAGDELPLRAGKSGIQRWNTACESAVQDGTAVKLVLRKTGGDAWQASAIYNVHRPKAGEMEFAVELSTQDKSFHTVHFYLPIQPKAEGSKVRRRYVRIPMKEFKMDGEVKRYSVKTAIPEEDLAYAGFGIEFRSKKPASVTIHSATLTAVSPKD